MMNILFPCLGGRSLFLLMIGIVNVESFAPSRVTTHFHGSSVHKRHMPEFRSHTPRGFSTFSRIRGSQFTAYPSSSSSLAVSATSAVAASLRSSLHGSHSFVLSALFVVSSCGIAMEQRTTFGKALSAPLVTMLISLCMANVGIIPFNSMVYTLVNQVLVPLAVPLFLFDSDLNRVVRDAGSLLAAFFVGAISTVMGTLGALYLIPLKSLGEQGWKVASALTARHIGGAINFVAVADTLKIDGGIVSAAIAADNVVVALYFAFLFYMAVAGEPEVHANEIANDKDTIMESSLGEDINLPNGGKPMSITTSSIAYSIATASCLVSIGSAITGAICPNLSSLVITSLLTVVSATIFPSWFESLRQSGTAMGILFLQMFFAASGAGGSLLLVLRQAPSLIAFSALQLAIHFIVLMGVGRGLMRLDKNELFLASNANVGGPTTAAAMAQAKEWRKLVLPALLVGVLGYAMATALSLSLGPVLIRLASR